MSVESDFDAQVASKDSTDGSMISSLDTQSAANLNYINTKWAYLLTVRTSGDPATVAAAQSNANAQQALFDSFEVTNNSLRNKYAENAKTAALVARHTAEKSIVTGYLNQKAGAQTNYNNCTIPPYLPTLQVEIDKFADLAAIAQLRVDIIKAKIDAKKAVMAAVS